MENKYQLSIGMIVKNEEKYLERCLTALLPLKEEISCEIIVTDTGSTDKTVEIAQKYADTVLNFEWCDDFATARNTGVEVATGSWFMFVDADEIFDDSVMEIAKFIKSDGRDSYDSATFIVRSFTTEGGEYREVPLRRIYNSTHEKRKFLDRIHEYIPTNGKTFAIDAVANHYGYILEVNASKEKRNKILLEKELKEDPNNIKVIKHLFGLVDRDYQEKLANQVFDLVDNDYQNLQHQGFAVVMYPCLGNVYIQKCEYDLVIKVCERYFSTELVKIQNPQENLPTQEMLCYFGIALFYKNDFENSLEKFNKYQEVYLYLSKNPDQIYASASKYSSNNQNIYNKSVNFIIDCYLNLNDLDNLDLYLSKNNLYTSFVQNEKHLNDFIVKTIQNNAPVLFNKVVDCCNQSNIEYGYNKLRFILIGQLYFNNDISYFTQNYSIEAFNNLLLSSFGTIQNLEELLYEKLMDDIEVNNLKEVKVYLQIAFIYLFKQIDILKNNKASFKYKEQIENIFVFYIESMIYYLNEVYQPVMLQKQNLDLLSKEECMCGVLISSFDNRADDKVEYVKALKEALAYNEQFKYIILNSIEIIEGNSNVQSKAELDEFKELAVKIKQSISVLIVKKQFDQAKSVLEQYKSINPTDPDIEKFNKLMI